MAKIPTTPAEIDAQRQQLADHLTDPATGNCKLCDTYLCPPWRLAAVALWWTDLDGAYEPHATEQDRRLKREISRTHAGAALASLKAPLTEAEVTTLRQQLTIHRIDGDTGLCPFCGIKWCTSWVLAASCLQLNGLDQTFLMYVRAVAEADHVLPS